MSTSKHQIQVKANDQTASAFNSIKNRAGATGQQINSMLRGALTAAAGYLSFRALKGGVDELGHLSDVAQKAGLSVDELTKTAAAFNTLGIQGMNVDTIAQAFKYMEKTTGRQGMAGFYETLREIGKIPDASKRGEEAMRIFSRAGLNFMPLINAAEDGTAALENVIRVFPGISQAAAEAGDAAADSLGLIWKQLRYDYLNGLGTVLLWASTKFNNGMVESSAAAARNMGYYFQLTCLKIAKWFEDMMLGIREKFVQGWTWIQAYWEADGWGGDAIDAANSWSKAVVAQIRKESGAGRFDDYIKDIEFKIENNRRVVKYLEENLKKSTKDRHSKNVALEEEAKKAKENAARKRSVNISNSLMTAGSAEVLKLQMLGPRTEAEQKKQTKLLEKIEKNTADAADSGEDIEVAFG